MKLSQIFQYGFKADPRGGLWGARNRIFVHGCQSPLRRKSSSS